MDRSARLAEVFRDTQDFYQEDPILAQSVRNSIGETRLYAADDYPVLPPQTERTGVVRVSGRKTVQAAIELRRTYPEKKIAVLNFASATRPGGGVKNGSSTQEESLCRCSTLYPTLDQHWLWNSFYCANRETHEPLHSDACIYSPSVVICKTYDDVPARLQPEEFVTVDVISCAAPNLRPSGDGKTVNISHEELCRLLRCRAMHILHIAAVNQVEMLVLGAFGCGIFANDPGDVKSAFSYALDEYRKWFDLVEFAVYCRDGEEKTYQEFRFLDNYHHVAKNPVTILNAGQEARKEYGEAFGAELKRLTVEQLNALHGGRQLAIPIMGGEYILFIEGPAAVEDCYLIGNGRRFR